MPMRFADINGTLINVYQAIIQMTDETASDWALAMIDEFGSNSEEN